MKSSNLKTQVKPKSFELDRTEEFDRTTKNENTHRTGLSPTETISAELQGSYQYFNSALFGDELPDCMITIDDANRSAFGYFSPKQFTTKGGTIIDQISINPRFTLTSPIEDVMDTLVHEMAHLWMANCSGKHVTSGYHCKVWGKKMESIGLIPSDTGKPGGKKTGYRMSDYPESGGKFEQAVAVMVANGFAITWGTLTQEMRQALSPENSDANGNGNDLGQQKERSKGKIKFTCPACNQSCWGAASLKLICAVDHQLLVRVEQPPPNEASRNHTQINRTVKSKN